MTDQAGPRIDAPAPDVALPDQHGAEVTLTQLRDGRDVVLVFYPFAFSRVCTGELEALRDLWPQFDREDVSLVGVSCDPKFTLRAYAEAEALPFPLLSDFWPHGAVAAAYGVFDEQLGCPQRSTFIVDRTGVLRWAVHNPVGEARDPQAYLSVLKAIRN